MPFCLDGRAVTVGVEVPHKHLKVLKCHIFTVLNQIETVLHILPPGASRKKKKSKTPSLSPQRHSASLHGVTGFPCWWPATHRSPASVLLLPDAAIGLSLQPPSVLSRLRESTAWVMTNISPWTRIWKQTLFSKTNCKGRQNCWNLDSKRPGSHHKGSLTGSTGATLLYPRVKQYQV